MEATLHKFLRTSLQNHRDIRSGLGSKLFCLKISSICLQLSKLLYTAYKLVKSQRVMCMYRYIYNYISLSLCGRVCVCVRVCACACFLIHLLFVLLHSIYNFICLGQGYNHEGCWYLKTLTTSQRRKNGERERKRDGTNMNERIVSLYYRQPVAYLCPLSSS